MNDECEESNTNIRVIRRVNKSEMACLLNDIKAHPEKYPDNIKGWRKWLDEDSMI